MFPLFTGRPSIKGNKLWQRFVIVRRLRDALVHPKDRGQGRRAPGESPNPKDPGIYGQLIRGDADTVADDAIAMVRALRPEFMPEHVLKAMKLT